jgi:hypothetical protein
MSKPKKHDEERSEEGGGINPPNNPCNACKDGLVMGGSVYCSVDGRFHPLNDNLTCKSFIQRR